MYEQQISGMVNGFGVLRDMSVAWDNETYGQAADEDLRVAADELLAVVTQTEVTDLGEDALRRAFKGFRDVVDRVLDPVKNSEVLRAVRRKADRMVATATGIVKLRHDQHVEELRRQPARPREELL